MRAGRFLHIVACLRSFERGSETQIDHIIRLSDIHKKKQNKKTKQNKMQTKQTLL